MPSIGRLSRYIEPKNIPNVSCVLIFYFSTLLLCCNGRLALLRYHPTNHIGSFSGGILMQTSYAEKERQIIMLFCNQNGFIGNVCNHWLAL